MAERKCTTCGFDYENYPEVDLDICDTCKKEEVCDYCLTTSEAEMTKPNDDRALFECPDCSGQEPFSHEIILDLLNNEGDD